MNKELKALNNAIGGIELHFTHVNLGGCGCVAAMLAEVLRPQYPLMRIVNSNGMWSQAVDIDEVRVNMYNPLDKHEWDNNDMHFSHLWVEIWADDQWLAVDSDGIRPLDDMYSKYVPPGEGSFTYEEIKALASTDEGWNWMFDRDQLPGIQAYINDNVKPLVH